MSSPARSSSSVSATSINFIGMGGSSSSNNNNNAAPDDNSPFHFSPDLTSVQDLKEESLILLKSDLMAALHKEVKSLDEDSWKFAQPRSRIHLISNPGRWNCHDLPREQR